MKRSSGILYGGLTFALLSLTGCAPWPEPGEASQPTPAQSNIGQKIADIAEQQMGVPYVYGGDTPKGFDCSGLVQYVYARAGVKLPRSAEGQYNATPRVARDSLEPGDIVFFNSDSGNLMHVGIYVGSHWFVHAPESGKPVSGARLDSAYWYGHYLGAGRPGG